jgi:luciferase family oxidoreductase group 1
MIGHVADVTRRIRVGSGGVMLPNHAPLKVAESFRMLEALHPGRVDLGLGRAPGTDSLTALALRRSREAIQAGDFPQQLSELMAFLGPGFPEGHPFHHVKAMPDEVPSPEIWLLGSSDFSAQLAAQRGLRFAFAHHIQPEPAIRALRMYHDFFRPSAALAEPEALIGMSVLVADTEKRALQLRACMDLTLLRFHQSKSGRFPSVEEAEDYPYTGEDRRIIEYNRQRYFAGTPEAARMHIERLAGEGGVGEVMITSMIHDHTERRRSYELLAKVFELTPSPVPAGREAVSID